jgi:FkbM family methyltransferase
MPWPQWRNRRDDAHLRAAMAALLRPDANCIDVGANTGAVLADAVRLAPLGRHIAFEPIPAAYAALTERFPGVDVRRAALSDTRGTATFEHVISRPAYSGLKTRDYPGAEKVETIEVDVERLDDALPEGFAPALVKIDVEGAELGVLRGGIETLRRHRPIVVLEHGRGAREHYGTTAADIYGLLVDEIGLRIFDMDGNGPYRCDDFAEQSDGPRWNWVATPARRL